MGSVTPREARWCIGFAAFVLNVQNGGGRGERHAVRSPLVKVALSSDVQRARSFVLKEEEKVDFEDRNVGTRLILGRLEDTTEHQSDVAEDSYPGSVWLDTRDMRKPHYDRQHNQSY
jgi:hypothetical protein